MIRYAAIVDLRRAACLIGILHITRLIVALEATTSRRSNPVHPRWNPRLGRNC